MPAQAGIRCLAARAGPGIATVGRPTGPPVGQIAANANNDVGIAGLDWSAKILPMRVLGKCGGTSEDVVAGILWAAGVRVEGAPVNAHPAKIVNLSLGGFGECSAAEQEAVDELIAQGTFVVASAGNEADDAAFYSPGSCGGVINVGALSRVGEHSSYSNYGRRVDISPPGVDVAPDGLIISTHAEGRHLAGRFRLHVRNGNKLPRRSYWERCR